MCTDATQWHRRPCTMHDVCSSFAMNPQTPHQSIGSVRPNNTWRWAVGSGVYVLHDRLWGPHGSPIAHTHNEHTDWVWRIIRHIPPLPFGPTHKQHTTNYQCVLCNVVVDAALFSTTPAILHSRCPLRPHTRYPAPCTVAMHNGPVINVNNTVPPIPGLSPVDITSRHILVHAKRIAHTLCAIAHNPAMGQSWLRMTLFINAQYATRNQSFCQRHWLGSFNRH